MATKPDCSTVELRKTKPCMEMMIELMSVLVISAAKTKKGVETGGCPPDAGITCAVGLCCGMSTPSEAEREMGKMVYGDMMDKMTTLSATCQKKGITTLTTKDDKGKESTKPWACCVGECTVAGA